MALIINDLEKNLDLTASEMADINGGFGPYIWQPVFPQLGEASADATAGAFGVREARTFTDSYAEVGYGYAVAASESHSLAR